MGKKKRERVEKQRREREKVEKGRRERERGGGGYE